MPDIYAEVRALLTSLLRECFGEQAAGCRIQCPGKFSPAATAHARSCGADADAWCVRILARLQEAPLLLYGTPLIDTVEAEDGFLNFYFTVGVYDAVAEHILCELPAVRELPLPQDEVGYAAWRMAMLSRKGPAPIPDDPRVKKALWLAFGIPERLGDDRLTHLRKQDAARALIAVSRNLPPRERPALQRQLGSMAECALMLLCL